MYPVGSLYQLAPARLLLISTFEAVESAFQSGVDRSGKMDLSDPPPRALCPRTRGLKLAYPLSAYDRGGQTRIFAESAISTVG